MMDPALHSLLQRADIWLANSNTNSRTPDPKSLATGFAGLDRALNGGWPRGALTELILAQTGVGELRLLMPLLRYRSHAKSLIDQPSQQLQQPQQPQQPGPQPEQSGPLYHIWIDPPLLPYAPALLQQGVKLDNLLIVYPADRAQWLWTCLQALRSGSHNAVLCWSNKYRLRYADLRQLQVAASEYGSCGFLLRDLSQDRHILQHSTPAPLRLQLRALAGALNIEVLKQRGHIGGQQINLPQPAALQAQMPLRKRTVPANKIAVARAPQAIVVGSAAEARWL